MHIFNFFSSSWIENESKFLLPSSSSKAYLLLVFLLPPIRCGCVCSDLRSQAEQAIWSHYILKMENKYFYVRTSNKKLKINLQDEKISY